MDPKKLTAVPAVGDDACSRRGTPTGLRGLTASPRLSLMRSRRDSYETMTSGVSSCSTESRVASSCVTRQTSPDDCDRHKFIVWTAVQRNNCEKMSPTEKLECPMLRCRRRCDSHEMMLKHLYECKLLSTGEYWCYECEKPEMFTDANCKRCTGHPGRRRRIMSHAKNFFSSLGHRHKKDGHSASPSDDDSLFDASRFGLLDGTHQQVELSSSTEIVEIDSTELFPSPPPPQDMNIDIMSSAQRDQVSMRPSVMFGVSDDAQRAPVPVSPFPALQPLSEQLLDWDANYPPAGPEDPIRVPSPASFQERPLLQLNTSALDHYSNQNHGEDAFVNGNQLSHSLSLRSNGSTATTNSYGISPASVHSGAWTMGSAWDTDMTSLSSGMVSPTGCLSRGGSNASRRSCFDSVQHPETIAELPAELPGLESANFANANSLNLQTIQDPNLGVTGLPAQPTDPALLEALRNLGDIHTPSDNDLPTFLDAEALVSKSWVALQGDVSDSLTKLQHCPQNPFVAQLEILGPQGIRTRGLTAIQGYQRGQTHAEAIDFLSCVFLLRAFSTAICHNHETSHDLFQTTCQYINHMPSDSHRYTLEIMHALWATPNSPPDLSLECKNLSREPTDTTLPLKALGALFDSASLFLDHMEYAAVAFEPSSLEILGSNVWAWHQINLQEHHRSDDNLQALLLHSAVTIESLYTHSYDFTTRMNGILSRIQRGQLVLARRAELEFLHAGKHCIPPDQYIDTYVPGVRHLCDALYERTAPDLSRQAFHQAGLSLVDAIMSKHSRGIMQAAQDVATVEPLLGGLVVGMPESATDHADAVAFDDFLSLDDSDALDSIMTLDAPPLEPTVDATGPEPTVAAKSEAGDALEASPGAQKVEAKESCKLCGFRPKGDPKWFRGSMAKHMKHQHSTQPPKIYKCPYPNCKSEYRNRPDNLRQHQLEKGHFVGEETGRRPSKRKKIDHPLDD